MVEALQREGSMAKAVIERNALADAFGTAPQDHDLLSIRWRGLIFRFVARIEIRRKTLELRSARVHAIENCCNTELFSPLANRSCVALQQQAQARIRHAV